MTIRLRPYIHPQDFEPVGSLLNETYLPDGRSLNWRQDRWEYALYHPLCEEASLSRNGIWEDGGRIVAVAHGELRPGGAYFEIRPGYEHLKPEMLRYAEAHLSKQTEGGRRTLRIWLRDRDTEFQALAAQNGYRMQSNSPDWISRWAIPDPFPAITLPEGFRLLSLQDENDLRKVNRCLWRGFDHPGEAPEEDIEGRKKMQSAPNFRKDLTVVVQAPDSNYVVFCGLWYDPAWRVATVEPLATDPDYRRMGLARAAVYEGARRCRALGATQVLVGSGQAFYEAIGFRKLFVSYPWVKELD
jgi:GNAT superfamily N-acetyltransferase